jgi:hypothetical protein
MLLLKHNVVRNSKINNLYASWSCNANDDFVSLQMPRIDHFGKDYLTFLSNYVVF